MFVAPSPHEGRAPVNGIGVQGLPGPPTIEDRKKQKVGSDQTASLLRP